MEREGAFVGRGEQLAACEHAVLHAHGVLVSGPPGVGKTRLAHELVALLAARGWSTVSASASAATASVPFGALGHLVSAAHSDAPSLLYERAQAYLDTQRDGRPLVFCIDDAHLIDDTAASFVHHLVATRASALVIVVRAGEVAPAPIVKCWQDFFLPRVELEPLSLRAVQQLLVDALGGHVAESTAQTLWNAAGCDLHYLHAIVADALEARTLAADDGVWWWHGGLGAARRLHELVGNEVASLDEGRRSLLEMLAIGEPLPIAVAEKLTSPGAVYDAERDGIVSVVQDQVLTAHPAYREVVRARLPAAARRRWSRALAEAMENDPHELVRVVTWRLDTGEHVEANLLDAAAREAVSRQDPATAERFARAAEAAIPLARALTDQGRAREACDVLERIDGPPANAIEDADILWETVRASSFARGRLDIPLAALASAQDRAVERASAVAMEAMRVPVLAFAGDMEEARASVAALPATTDPFAQALTLAAGATVAMFNGHFSEALVDARDASLLLVDQPGGPAADAGRSLVVLVRALALQGLGHWDDADMLLHRAVGVPGPVTPRSYEAALVGALRGRGLLQHGRAVDALRCLREAASILLAADGLGFNAWVLCLLAEAYATTGDLAQARRTLARAHESPDAENGMFIDDGRRAEAWVLAASGEVSAARRLIVRARDALERDGQYVFAIAAAIDAVRLGGGRNALRHLAVLAREVEGRGAAAAVSYAQARERGDLSALERCAAAFDEAGLEPVAADVWDEVAADASALDLRTRAATAARRAGELRVRGSAGPAVAVAEQRSLPPTLLTRREAEVARLVAERLTNQEVAERLGMSIRTVESHLYQAYAKLGISRRSELAAALLGARVRAAPRAGNV